MIYKLLTISVSIAGLVDSTSPRKCFETQKSNICTINDKSLVIKKSSNPNCELNISGQFAVVVAITRALEKKQNFDLFDSQCREKGKRILEAMSGIPLAVFDPSFMQKAEPSDKRCEILLPSETRTKSLRTSSCIEVSTPPNGQLTYLLHTNDTMDNFLSIVCIDVKAKLWIGTYRIHRDSVSQILGISMLTPQPLGVKEMVIPDTAAKRACSSLNKWIT